jgi:hypothetical protein
MLESDPVAALGNVLALLELYECNQPDTSAPFLEDLPFLGTCFSSKRCNGWIAAVGNGDRKELEAAVNARWQFKFFSGPRRPTGVYILLSMLARYAYVYGRAPYGDLHDLGHFVEDYCPGVLVCCGEWSDLELALCLAAMKMGVPAVVPKDYPFSLGRMIRADGMEEIVEAVVGFPNVRRLLSLPEIPQLPAYCDAENAKEEIVPELTWGGTPKSFILVRKGAAAGAPGFRVEGSPGKDLGVLITIDAEPMDPFDCAYVEQTVVPKLKMMKRIGVRYTENEFAVQQAAGTNLDPSRIGEVLLAATGNLLPRVKDRIFVEVVFDGARLASLAPEVTAQKEARRREIAEATEESVDWFVGCTGCSPFAPDHVCIVTPQRPPQCGRPIGLLKTGALYSYDDLTNIYHSRLQSGLNSFTLIRKGRCLDARRGEWEGANAHAVRMTQGRTKRVFLHSLDDFPHTGCGCFQMILFRTDRPRAGIGIMERGYAGRCPDGRTWKDLYYALAGKQAPGVTGAAPGYLQSAKFLQAHGGWDAVVWVSPKIATMMASSLPASVEVGQPAWTDGIA